MVNFNVVKVLIGLAVQDAVTCKLVGHNGRVFLAHLVQNRKQLLATQLLTLFVRHSDDGVNPAAIALKNPNNGCFARTPATLAFLGCLAFVCVLFSRFAALMSLSIRNAPL